MLPGDFASNRRWQTDSSLLKLHIKLRSKSKINKNICRHNENTGGKKTCNGNAPGHHFCPSGGGKKKSKNRRSPLHPSHPSFRRLSIRKGNGAPAVPLRPIQGRVRGESPFALARGEVGGWQVHLSLTKTHRFEAQETPASKTQSKTTVWRDGGQRNHSESKSITGTGQTACPTLGTHRAFSTVRKALPEPQNPAPPRSRNSTAGRLGQERCGVWGAQFPGTPPALSRQPRPSVRPIPPGYSPDSLPT